jgi:hypothetical protein
MGKATTFSGMYQSWGVMQMSVVETSRPALHNKSVGRRVLDLLAEGFSV